MRIVPAFLIALLSLTALFSTVPQAMAAPATPDDHTQPQANVINVTGTISSNTTWTAGTAYQVTSRVTLASNTVLTIQPGAIIKFNLNADMRINGTLIAEGTAANPIIFTSFRDDSVGGDTNGDGDATSPEPGNWGSIGFRTGSVTRIAHAQFRYGGGQFSNNSILDATDGSLTINNSAISNSSTRGLAVSGGVSTLRINNTRFDANDGSAASISLSGLTTWQMSNNTCINNRFDVIRIDGTLTRSTNLEDPGCVLLVDSRVNINSNVVFTITPGTIFKFENNADMRINGTFEALGTAAQPIIFTSFRDDSVGGDSNGDGDATSPEPGNWGSIGFRTGSVARIDHARFRYGGGQFSNDSILDATDGSITINNSVISNSSTRGLRSSGPTRLTINTTRFESNARSAASVSLFGLNTWQLSNNTCAGNGINAIFFEGTLASSTNLADPGCVLYSGGFTVNANVTFTLTPGTVMKFDDGSGVSIDGIFNAQGTLTLPITFTSFRDDSVGGDINGDGNATTPTRGDWNAINFRSGSTGRISHTQVRYGGGSSFTNAIISASGGNVTLDHVLVEESARDGFNGNVSNARITNSTFRLHEGHGLNITGVAAAGDFVIQHSIFESSKGRGVRIAAGRVTMACSVVRNNEGGGVLVSTLSPNLVTLLRLSIANNQGEGLTRSGSSNIDARNLWWGNASGPGGAGPGSGNAVSANVNFSPWLSAVPECAGNVDLQLPYIQVSYPTGVPGSVLTVRGFNFPASTTVTINVNERELGTVQSNTDGAFIFVFNTTNASPGLYTATAAARATTTIAQTPVEASVAFNLVEDALQRERDEDAAGAPAITIPAGLVRTGNMIYLPLLRR
jgi:hypothetical protein